MRLHLSLSPTQAMVAGGDMLKLDLDLKGVTKKLDGITKAAQAAVRPAAQSGAQVFYDRVRAEVPVSSHGHWFHGSRQKYWFDAGSLRDSIYQVYAKGQSSEGVARYEISFNHTKAPYGFMVLRGTSSAAANDFIGRAYDAEQRAAMQVARNRLQAEIKKAL